MANARAMVDAAARAGRLAGDHDPGDGRVAGQALARLPVQRPGPARVPTKAAGVAEQAVEVDGDQ
jgi:hypothetical protein